MREFLNAIAYLLTQDTLRSTVASVSGNDVTLVSGGSSWSVGDIGHMTGANDQHCGTVTAVSGNVITLDEAPSAVPTTDELCQGYLEWAREAVGNEQAIYVTPGVGEDPRDVLDDPGVGPRVVCILEFSTGLKSSAYRQQWVASLRIVGRDMAYIEGMLRRVERLADMRRDAEVKAHDLYTMTVAQAGPVSPAGQTGRSGSSGPIEIGVPIYGAMARVA